MNILAAKIPDLQRENINVAGVVAQPEFGETLGEMVPEQVPDVGPGQHQVVGPRSGAEAAACAHTQQHRNCERVL